MRKGLPRPVNDSGQLVPYVASGPHDLGSTDLVRWGEIVRDRLCQVCGEALVGDVVAVFDLRPHMTAVLDRPRQGFSHDRPCFRLALAHCPFLANSSHYRVVRMPLEEVPDPVDGVLSVPLEVQEQYEVSDLE